MRRQSVSDHFSEDVFTSTPRVPYQTLIEVFFPEQRVSDISTQPYLIIKQRVLSI